EPQHHSGQPTYRHPTLPSIQEQSLRLWQDKQPRRLECKQQDQRADCKDGNDRSGLWKTIEVEIPPKLKKCGTHAVRRKTGSV
ncbi:unnamed protein product, partial [Ectocarpus sp. 13 AM-2016]